MNMNKFKLLGFLRHVLTFGGGIFVAKGYIDEGTAKELGGAIATIIGFGLSYFATEKK